MRATGHIGLDEPFAGLFTQGMVVHESYRKADGTYAEPAEVAIQSEGDHRRAVLAATGEPVEIGPIEKMSKSKRNTVDPDDIIATYGADVARWFMLSDSPPDRDVIWTEEGVQGASRFAQRLWRLVNEIAAVPAGKRGDGGDGPALEIHRSAHRTLDRVTRALEDLRFNTAVAFIYGEANFLEAAVRDARDAPAPARAALREAGDMLVQMFAPMMPHLAEECWAALGHRTLVAEAAWPVLDPSLLVEATVTLPVQVNGKKRADVTVARDAGETDIEAAVLQLDAVRRALAGRAPKKVIVVPQRIVNVVA
jgi:leucyl-tRNA synthetase